MADGSTKPLLSTPHQIVYDSVREKIGILTWQPGRSFGDMPLLVQRAIEVMESIALDLSDTEKREIVEQIVHRSIDKSQMSPEDKQHFDFLVDQVLPSMINLLIEISEGKHQQAVGCFARIAQFCYNAYLCCCECRQKN